MEKMYNKTELLKNNKNGFFSYFFAFPLRVTFVKLLMTEQ